LEKLPLVVGQIGRVCFLLHTHSVHDYH
jgi:hypothetical protein